jgi:tetratricopeptide (TPR) repeat protein
MNAIIEEARQHHRQGRLEQAEELYRRVLAKEPDHTDALRLMAIIAHQRGDYETALRHATAALERDPTDARAFNTRGGALRMMNRLEEALESYERAAACDPSSAKALRNRGEVLHELQRYEEAVASFDAALELEPRHPGAMKNRATALQRLWRLEEALASYDLALAIKPDFPEAWNNRGSALTELGRLEEALASYDQAIALKADFTNAHVNRAMARLLTGRLSEGWRDFEWRWKENGQSNRLPALAAAPWQGEELLGRRIAIWSEQGLGDSIQFARYARVLLERGASVTLLTQPKLVRILRSLPAQIEVAASIEGDRTFDFQCPLMDLPLRCGTELSSIPAPVPYLSAEPERVQFWRRRLGGHGFRVGIVWQGNPTTRLDQGRSVPLSEFLPLMRVPGVRIISLQKHVGLEQIAHLPEGAALETLGEDYDSGPDAFVDAAAVMANLDLIVTSDTAMAHLAGALGRPAWVALRCVPDWRWLLERTASPWYPTMRLFRQERLRDWKSVFARMAAELASRSLDAAPPADRTRS